MYDKWPIHLFSTLGDEFQRTSESIRGPGVGVLLPAMTSLVLSRAETRSSIPETIRDLRAEYEDSRSELWAIVREMWTAPTIFEQKKIALKLKEASDSMFGVAFESKFDALQLGINATDLIGLSPVALLAAAREQYSAKARVGAVSFAKQLSVDLREQLLNQRSIVRRHFTDSELVELGASR